MACSGCGMSPTTLPASLRIAGDVAQRTVRVAVDVAAHHAALASSSSSVALVGDVPTLTVLERDEDLLARRRSRVVQAVLVVLDPQPLVPVEEVQVLVAHQRAGQQMRLAQDLEAVADAEHRHARAAASTIELHHRGEPGDRAAPQIVTVREPAGEDHRVDAAQIGVAVPQRAPARRPHAHRPGGVAIVEGAGERDDADLHAVTCATAGPGSPVPST